MKKRISNIVFTKNRPLQLDAYLESLHNCLPPDRIQTYVLYKEELFSSTYRSVFRKYEGCIVVEESDFYRDVLKVIDAVDTEFILFGVDDVVYFDSVDIAVIEEIFSVHSDDIFGFSFRLGPDSLRHAGDDIQSSEILGQEVWKVPWKAGESPHSRYPFELQATVYRTELVRRIMANCCSRSAVADRLLTPDSALIRLLSHLYSTRSIMKSFGYFFSPNTFESWNCRWCREHPESLPTSLYFQKLCTSAIQVNMVNTSTDNTFDASGKQYTVESLNERYQDGYRFDIDWLRKNRPTEPHSGEEYFKLSKR